MCLVAAAFSPVLIFLLRAPQKEPGRMEKISAVRTARAAAGDNITGYAWNNQIGWISFNCENDSSCGVNSYGVNIDSSGAVFGYAWSPNVGWISFNRCGTDDDCGTQDGDTGAPPGSPFQNPGSDNRIAEFNPGNKELKGWAKILSMGNDGWIKIRKEGNDGGQSYGVYVTPAGTGEFEGYAWNGNDDGTGIGWISFNCANESGGCAGQDYKVKAELPQISSVTVNPTFNLECSQLTVSWDASKANSFDVYRSSLSGFAPNNGNKLTSAPLGGGATSYTAPDSLTPGTAYYYVVRAYGVFGHTDSLEVSGATDAICRVDGAAPGSNGIAATHECPNIVNLSWEKPGGSAVSFEIKRCRIDNPGDCDSNTDPLYGDLTAGDGCYYPTVAAGCNGANCGCQTTDFVNNETTKRYKYIIRGTNGIDQGKWSVPSNSIQPCQKLPKWKEVKSQ